MHQAQAATEGKWIMDRNLNDIIESLPARHRRKIEKRAAALIAEEINNLRKVPTHGARVPIRLQLLGK